MLTDVVVEVSKEVSVESIGGLSAGTLGLYQSQTAKLLVEGAGIPYTASQSKASSVVSLIIAFALQNETCEEAQIRRKLGSHGAH